MTSIVFDGLPIVEQEWMTRWREGRGSELMDGWSRLPPVIKTRRSPNSVFLLRSLCPLLLWCLSRWQILPDRNEAKKNCARALRIESNLLQPAGAVVDRLLDASSVGRSPFYSRSKSQLEFGHAPSILTFVFFYFNVFISLSLFLSLWLLVVDLHIRFFF